MCIHFTQLVVNPLKEEKNANIEEGVDMQDDELDF